MPEPPSPTVGTEQPLVSGADKPIGAGPAVVGADEQSASPDGVDVDVERWCRLAQRVLEAEDVDGELTLTFVDRDEIASLNAEHLGQRGPTDVLSFPLDSLGEAPGVPRLLGDVVICPAVAAEQAPGHAGSRDDELALLVVHGVLHVLGHDHADVGEALTMRAAERAHLEAFHWGGPAPATFRQEHDS